jgi:hypothetical protein
MKFSMNTKNLVITSDDFGMSVGINKGIYAAALAGHIQCTNYMVPTPFFEQAVFLARDLNIDIGVHFTLTNEWDFYKWRPLTKARTLVDSEGYLYKNINQLMQYSSWRDIKNECYSQLALAQKKDPRISFIDLHMCIPTFEGGKLVNPEYELELLYLVKEIADETGLVYPYELDNNQLRYFDSHISISGKETAIIKDYLTGLTSGYHHLSCHCSIDSSEQHYFSEENSEAYLWARNYRIDDAEVLGSIWFNNIIQEENIKLIDLSGIIKSQKKLETQNNNGIKLTCE